MPRRGREPPAAAGPFLPSIHGAIFACSASAVSFRQVGSPRRRIGRKERQSASRIRASLPRSERIPHFCSRLKSVLGYRSIPQTLMRNGDESFLKN